jgi:hypothetical protein
LSEVSCRLTDVPTPLVLAYAQSDRLNPENGALLSAENPC